MARTLKVFRIAVGFHEVYVAAPSQKMGLTAEPLDQPGKVIKRLRGSEAEHLAALGNSTKKRAARSKGAKVALGREAPRKKPLPRPDREPLDQAGCELEDAKREGDAVARDFQMRERKLGEERHKAERAAADAVRKGTIGARCGEASFRSGCCRMAWVTHTCSWRGSFGLGLNSFKAYGARPRPRVDSRSGRG